MEIDLVNVVRTFVRRWWVVAIIVVIGGLLGYSYGLTIDKTYQANTQLFLPEPLTNSSGVTRQASTYTSFVTSGPVLDLVIIDQNLEFTREELSQHISVSTSGGGQIIEILVTDTDPQRAADIANSTARNFESYVLDLTLGEYNRNIDSLQAESDRLKDQITGLNQRIGTLDTVENEGDSQAQAELALLQDDRLRLQQNKADIDASIRSLKSELSMSTAPVIVADFARPPENPIAPSPILLAALGVFVGGLIGLAALLYMGLSDRTFRSNSQAVSTPVLASVSGSHPSGPEVDQLAARIRHALADDVESVVIVAPKHSDIVSGLAQQLRESSVKTLDVREANGLLAEGAALTTAEGADGAIVVAQRGTTSLDELDGADLLLRGIGVQILGTVIVGK